MLESLDIMQDKDHAIARREGGECALQCYSVDRTGKDGIATSEVALGGVFSRRVICLFQGDEVQTFLAKVHEDEVDGKSMQPGGECGLSAKAAKFAEEVEEGVLGHVLGL